LTGLVIAGFKIQADRQKMAELADQQAAVPDLDPGVAAQDAIRNARDSKLNAAAHAPQMDSNTQTTIKTVIPGKTITQKVPGSSSSSSSSKSSSSSSNNTTKTS
jgi:hypothetical protein